MRLSFLSLGLLALAASPLAAAWSKEGKSPALVLPCTIAS